MIYVNDSSSGIIMFTTNSNMRYICQSDVDIFCDGTFKYCPHLCYQLYTFLGFKNGKYIQCILFLLPSKSKPVYLKMLQFFIDSCKENWFTLSISSLHIDVEEAVIDVTTSTWPDVIIKGYYFHLSQAWGRKIQNVGLANEYKDLESVIGKWLKVFFGLSFLKNEEVEDAIAFDIFSSLPDDERAVSFADYVLKNYAQQDARFPPKIWANCFTTSIQTFLILWTNLSTYWICTEFVTDFYHKVWLLS